jgi:hypothetical protein
MSPFTQTEQFDKGNANPAPAEARGRAQASPTKAAK